jgi:hypothetical protein
VQTPLRSALAIHALALNFTRAAGKQTTTPRRNTWPIILAAQQVLNVDASFFEDLHSGSCGAIVRDHEGLKLLQSMGCHNVLVRMDNSIVVDAIHLNEGHSMVAAPVLDDCRIITRVREGHC